MDSDLIDHKCVVFRTAITKLWGFLGGSMVKNLPANARRRIDPWVRKSPWRRKWQPTPGFLPGESQGQRSQVGCCLWGRTGSDTTEAT